MKVILYFIYAAFAQSQLEVGVDAINKMTGCYLVDYSYTEVESLKPGYQIREDVYDVNKNKTVKEWIYTDRISDTKIRLQHVMFAVDLKGDLMPNSELKHTGEDWEYNSAVNYDFKAPNQWETIVPPSNTWTRRITNLDDGLRYQCAAPWSVGFANPEWSCENYAPIPGRETRDMKRSDYQTLQRNTKVIVYPNNWLERQDNIKTIHTATEKSPLARELGKNWYVRLPDADCKPALAFMAPRKAFWDLLRTTWESVLDGKSNFTEKPRPKGSPSRYIKILDLEDQALSMDLKDPNTASKVSEDIKLIINEFREI